MAGLTRPALRPSPTSPLPPTTYHLPPTYRHLDEPAGPGVRFRPVPADVYARQQARSAAGDPRPARPPHAFDRWHHARLLDRRSRRAGIARGAADRSWLSLSGV